MKTNLEHYKDLLSNKNSVSCAYWRDILGNLNCAGRSCHECHTQFIEWALEECKELKIQLLQWEYDLIEVHIAIGHGSHSFDCVTVLRELKNKGHFKNVKEDVGLGYMLENCEIVDESNETI